MRRTFVANLPKAMTPNSDTERGEWYVVRQSVDDAGEEVSEYLHSDGEWRSSTFSNGWPGVPTGYFDSEKDAKDALAKARGTIAN